MRADITAGVTYTNGLNLMMDESRVTKERWPVSAGLFVDIAKMGFTIPGYLCNPRISQLTVIFQQPSLLKLSFYGVFYG